MKEQTGETYQSSEFAAALSVAEAKVGKTVFSVASALGVLPWQKYGGVVDRPDNLHVIALDAGAVTGAQRFVSEVCGAPPEALKFRIYNHQDDVKATAISTEEWDYDLYNSLVQTVRKIQDRCKSGSPVVLVSSLTTLAQALERALAGPPGEKRGAGMDQSKWNDFARQITELRNMLQAGSWHTIWEAHIYKPPATGQNKSEDDRKETLQVAGKAGYNFPNNVEQIFRIRRSFGGTYEGTKADRMWMDTRPTMEFIAGGRLFTEALDAKEECMTKAFHKLGLRIGQWGKKAKKK